MARKTKQHFIFTEPDTTTSGSGTWQYFYLRPGKLKRKKQPKRRIGFIKSKS